MKNLLPIMAAAAAAVAVGPPALAQVPPPKIVVCGQGARDSLLQMYGDHVVVSGLTVEGLHLEVFADEDGAWVITTTTPSGLTCAPFVGRSLEVSRGGGR